MNEVYLFIGIATLLISMWFICCWILIKLLNNVEKK